MQITPTTLTTWWARREQLVDEWLSRPESSDAPQVSERKTRLFVTSIVAGLLLGSSLLGIAIKAPTLAPGKPAVDLSFTDFSSDCNNAAPGCNANELLRVRGDTPYAWLQFAGDANPTRELVLIQLAGLSVASDAGSALTGVLMDADGALGRHGGGGGSSAGAAASAGGVVPQLLAITRLPNMPLSSSPAGLSSPGAPARVAQPGTQPQSVHPADETPVTTPISKKPRPLVPRFTPELENVIPMIARVAPAEAAPPTENSPPPDIGPAQDIIPVTLGPVNPTDPNTGPGNQNTPTLPTLDPLAVPEPPALILLGLGLVIVGFFARGKL